MKGEKEIGSKSYIWWDDNYGEMPHRKKKERNGGMGKITKSQWFSSWGGGNDLTVFFFFFFVSPTPFHFLHFCERGIVFQEKLKDFGVRQHNYNCQQLWTTHQELGIVLGALHILLLIPATTLY